MPSYFRRSIAVEQTVFPACRHGFRCVMKLAPCLRFLLHAARMVARFDPRVFHRMAWFIGLEGRPRYEGKTGELKAVRHSLPLGSSSNEIRAGLYLYRRRAYFWRVSGTKRTGIVRLVVVVPSAVFSMTSKSWPPQVPPTGITSRPPGFN
jgi:hypothetical protein